MYLPKWKKIQTVLSKEIKMIEVYKAPTPQDAYILLSLLEVEGINAVVENDKLFNMVGELPYSGEILPTVYITNNSQKNIAFTIVNTYINNLNKKCNNKEWICEECRESNPDSFELCWNCQKEK